MKAKELLSIIQQSGKSVSKNNENLESIKRILSQFDNGTKAVKYSFIYEQMKKDYDSLPTDYQNSHFFEIIKDAFESLYSVICTKDILFFGNKIRNVSTPLYGTASLDGYNAHIFTDDEPIIVFNDELLMLTEKLVEIYTKFCWLVKIKKLSRKYAVLIVKNFIDVLYCFCNYKDAYNSIPLDWCEISNFDDLNSIEKIYETDFEMETYFVDVEYINFFYELGLSAYMWIASHEYAHLLLGHTKSENHFNHLELNNQDLQEYNFEIEKEYDADLLGAILTMESEQTLHLSNGIFFALKCMELSELRNTEHFVQTHPSTRLRMKRIFEYLENDYRYYLGNYKSIDDVFNLMCKEYKKFVKHLKDNNLKFDGLFELQKYLYEQYEVEL